MKLSHYPFNSGQAAEYLNVSLGHLHNLIYQGKGPRHIKYGGQLRFHMDDLDDWVATRCTIVTPNGMPPSQP